MSMRKGVNLLLVAATLLSTGLGFAGAEEQTISDRMLRHRAIDAAVWAMPLNVPVRDFWAITTYDLETASYLRDIEPSSIDSSMKDVKKNADGSVDIYFGPKAPKGKESNWLPTDPKRRFFLLARFYGPEPALFDGSFKLNNIELVK